MRLALVLGLVAGLAAGSPGYAQNLPDSVVEGKQTFDMKVLATDLAGPWEISWGPDGWLWVTERVGGRITRIDPADGTKVTAIEIEEVAAPGGQDGLMGLALHPELLQGTGNDYVYTAYTYNDESLGADETVSDPASPYRFLYTKIVRLTYDEASGTLGEPVELIAGLPASNDHNSGRMKIGPDLKLYYTIGDMGNNQLGNWCIPIEAQRLPTAEEIEARDYFAYQGKSLRLNLDGTIPEDNPDLGGVVSHVYTYGHRNMQGIDFASDGTLYGTEHGPKADDELNILVAGGNYGWPHVSGFRDDMAYQFARWADATTPCEELQFSDIVIDPSVPVEDETAFTDPMVDPLATMFTVPDDWNFTDPICEGIDFICWPTVAPSSLEVYEPGNDGVPGWGKSIILPTLKRGSIYRVPLSEDGQSVSAPIERYFQSENRFRDVAIGPDNRTIYVATDQGGLAEATGGGVTRTMTNPGAILVFTYNEDGAAADETADETAEDSTGDEASAATQPASFTAEQVARGKVAYDSNCSTCHGPDLLSARYGPPLAGALFARTWGERSVGELYAYTHDRMPPSRPGSLPDETYADIVAHILNVNGIPEGDTELPADPSILDTMAIGIDQ